LDNNFIFSANAKRILAPMTQRQSWI